MDILKKYKPVYSYMVIRYYVKQLMIRMKNLNKLNKKKKNESSIKQAKNLKKIMIIKYENLYANEIRMCI